MNSSQEIAGELVVSGGDAAKVLEPAEAGLNYISASVSTLVEAMGHDAVGFVGDYWLGAAANDFGSKVVAVVSFVGKESAHGGCERQNVGRGSYIGILTGSQMQNDRPAERIAQRMDFCRTTAPRPADGLIVLPPFPPEAHR
jgi:hypothetical protein